MKVKEILLKAINILNESNIDDAKLKSKIILSDLLNKPKEYLLIHEDEEINEKNEQEFWKKIKKLQENEPLQYIINKQEFYGLEFYVDKNVLIPQPDTEILVEESIEIINKIKEKNLEEIKLLDLCTGSGAIAISIAKNIEKIEIDASDISSKALEIAKRNAIKNDVKINCVYSNLFENIKEKYNIIVSNPPYIETETINNLSEEVKKEPILALDGGKDGLDFYRIIAQEAKKHLKEYGYLALEIGYNQKESVEEILKQNFYTKIYSKKDFGNNDRIVIAQI